MPGKPKEKTKAFIKSSESELEDEKIDVKKSLAKTEIEPADKKVDLTDEDKAKTEKIVKEIEPIETTRKKGPSKSEISSIETLFEVVSKLRIILDRTVNVNFGGGVAPLAHIFGKGVIKINIIDKLESHLKMWYDEPNDSRYIITLCNEKISFKSIDEMVTAVLSDYRLEREKSCVVLKEPKTLSVTRNSRCYEPETLGFPFGEILKAGIIDERYRVALDVLLQGRENPNGHVSFLNTVGFDYPPRGETRERILRYALGNSNRIVELTRRAISIHNSELGFQDPDVRILTGFETIHPTYDFNAFQGVLDAMPKASYVLRYELVTALSGFSATLSPIPTGDLMKSAGASAIKASWLSDVTTTTYNDEMGPEIASLFASYIVPGEIILDLDLSDIPESAIELRGIAAMGASLFLLYNTDTTFTNMTEASVVMIQRAIVRLGVQGRILRQRGHGGIWPLDDVSYINGPIDDLDGFRVINGNGGINQDGCRLVPDRLLSLFQGCGGRINYAINYDNYHDYSRDVHGPDNWTVYNSISAFLSRAKILNHLIPYFNIISKNILDFFVRINEHNKTHWYSPLRNSSQVQSLRNNIMSAKFAVRSSIRGKTLLHLMRSVSGKELTPVVSFNDIMKYSSGLIRIMSDFAIERSIVDRCLYDLGVFKEYTNSDILKIVCEFNPLLKYILEVGKHYNELKFLSSQWLNRFLENELSQSFSPLYERRISDLIPKGVLPKIVARLQVNGITRDEIINLINRKSVYMNVYNDDCTIIRAREMRSLVENRAYRFTLYGSREVPLEIRFPVPFSLSFEMSKIQDKYCINVNSDNQTSLLKTRLSMELAELHVLSFDVRNYRCPDDYTPSSTMIQTNFVRSDDIIDVIIKLDDFFNRLGDFSSSITLLANSRHTFVDV